jgi:hypothetical protein
MGVTVKRRDSKKKGKRGFLVNQQTRDRSFFLKELMNLPKTTNFFDPYYFIIGKCHDSYRNLGAMF